MIIEKARLFLAFFPHPRTQLSSKQEGFAVFICARKLKSDTPWSLCSLCCEEKNTARPCRGRYPSGCVASASSEKSTGPMHGSPHLTCVWCAKILVVGVVFVWGKQVCPSAQVLLLLVLRGHGTGEFGNHGSRGLETAANGVLACSGRNPGSNRERYHWRGGLMSSSVDAEGSGMSPVLGNCCWRWSAVRRSKTRLINVRGKHENNPFPKTTNIWNLSKKRKEIQSAIVSKFWNA